ncbi:hypothetical protein [Streptococcus sp. X13SY08]|nr:hypothetical protein [Streptococcus sp. X13SY08]
MAALVNFLFAAFAYLLPFSNQLFENESAYATMLTLGAVGSISAAAISSRVKSSIYHLLFNLLLSGLGVAIIGWAFFLPNFAWIFYVGNLGTEFFMTIFNIHFLSQIQMRVPNELMGRVFSVVFTIAIALMPLGTWFISHFPNAIHLLTFTGLGLGVMVLAILGMLYNCLKGFEKSNL